MDIRIEKLRKKDFGMARKFAISGMHLSWYTNTTIELYLYSKYFWCLEISRASMALGAYIDNKLVSVLLVDMNHEPKIFNSIFRKAFVRLGAFIINFGYKKASNTYDDANKEMLEAFQKIQTIDGELNFFAVDPIIKGKGIGTLLLNEFEKQQKGKRIYLYTDSGSTFQFYHHRGFEEVGKKDIFLEINKKEVPLTCFLFSKKIN